MEQTKTNGIECYSPAWSKALVILLSIIVGYVLVYQVLDNNILGWVFLLYVVIRIPFYSPDVIVYDEGVDVDRFGFKRFLAWDDLEYIRVGTINCQLHPRNLPKWVQWMVYDSILINSWHSNFKQVREKLEENQGKAGRMPPQRSYN